MMLQMMIKHQLCCFLFPLIVQTIFFYIDDFLEGPIVYKSSPKPRWMDSNHPQIGRFILGLFEKPKIPLPYRFPVHRNPKYGYSIQFRCTFPVSSYSIHSCFSQVSSQKKLFHSQFLAIFSQFKYSSSQL